MAGKMNKDDNNNTNNQVNYLMDNMRISDTTHTQDVSCNSPTFTRKGGGVKKQYSQLLKKNIARKLIQRRSSDNLDRSGNTKLDADIATMIAVQARSAETHSVTAVSKIRDSSGAYVISSVEIIKTPGVSIGFYIRQGDGFDRNDGIFISRIALGSVIDIKNLLQIGDEILYVNKVSVADMTLDDVVILLRIPNKLALTIKRRIAVSSSDITTNQSRSQASTPTNDSESSYSFVPQLDETDGTDSNKPDASPPTRKSPIAARTQQQQQAAKDCDRRSSDLLFLARKGMPSALERVDEKSIIDYKSLKSISQQIPSINRIYQTGNDSSYFSASESLDSASVKNYNYTSDSCANSIHEDSDNQQDSLSHGSRKFVTVKDEDTFDVKHTYDPDHVKKCQASSSQYGDDRRHTCPTIPISPLAISQTSQSANDTDNEDLVARVSNNEIDNSPCQSSESGESVQPADSASISSEEHPKITSDIEKITELNLEEKKKELPTISIGNDSYHTDSSASTPIDTPEFCHIVDVSKLIKEVLVRERSYSADDFDDTLSPDSKTTEDSIFDAVNKTKSEEQKSSKENNLLNVPEHVDAPRIGRKTSRGKLTKRHRSKSMSAMVGIGLVAAEASNVVSEQSPTRTSKVSKLFASPRITKRKRAQMLDVSTMLGLANSRKSHRVPSYTQAGLENDYVSYQSDSPCRTRDESSALTLVSGLLNISILCGKGMQTLQGKQRELYCSIAVDGEEQARTNTKRSVHTFNWDESFEIELECSREVSLSCYTGSSKSRQQSNSLCFRGIINLAKLCHSRGNTHQLALNTKPVGIIYIKLKFTEQASAFDGNPSIIAADIFGVDLAEITQRENDTVPQIVRKCITAIEQRGMETVGIYRLSGSAKRKQALRAEIEANFSSINFHNLDKYPDVNVITGILKDYLRELPEPLFTNELYQAVIDMNEITDAHNCHTYLSDLMKKLPTPNQDTLACLLNHLVRVAEMSDKNKMNLHNLAICFGPVVMCPNRDKAVDTLTSPSEAVDFKLHIVVLEKLLEVWIELCDKEVVEHDLSDEDDNSDHLAIDIKCGYSDSESDDESDSFV